MFVPVHVLLFRETAGFSWKMMDFPDRCLGGLYNTCAEGAQRKLQREILDAANVAWASPTAFRHRVTAAEPRERDGV